MNVACVGPVKLALAGLLLSASLVQASPITFSLLPADGAISGEAGSTIGWGYSITNGSTLWLEVFNFSGATIENTQAAESLFDYPFVAPGATHTVAYDPANLGGLFQLTWDATAPIDFITTGLFTISSSFYDGDPLAGGNFVEPAEDQVVAYTATVTAAATAVPEPSTLLLFTTSLIATGLVRRRRAGQTTLRNGLMILHICPSHHGGHEAHDEHEDH
jgi:hypothetical protein